MGMCMRMGMIISLFEPDTNSFSALNSPGLAMRHSLQAFTAGVRF